ncbi:MAG: FixH family protein [Syntrophales bacterium]|nr:FixH family protein [Syntrophales bacterium]
MKRIALAVCLLFLVTGLAYGKDYEITKKAGDVTVQITIDKNPPVTGQNRMQVGIRDAKGQEITDAAVSVDYGMPAMPGMPAMNYRAGAALKDKHYTTNLNFSMSGAWSINVKITRAGKTQTVKLNVDVK